MTIWLRFICGFSLLFGLILMVRGIRLHPSHYQGNSDRHDSLRFARAIMIAGGFMLCVIGIGLIAYLSLT